MSRVEVFLDETPGETRGVVMRDGVAEHLLIERDDDVAQHRLGARSAGLVVRVEPGLGGAFVDIGAGEPFAFLALKGDARAVEGERIEVEVSAEPRGGKGATVRRTGTTSAEPGLISAGPGVLETLHALAPGAGIHVGLDAIRAGETAEDEALSAGWTSQASGLDVSLERTRGMIAVDFDLTPGGRTPRQRANAEGLKATARALKLRRWAGLVVIDLIGGPQDGEAVLQVARSAFAEPGVVFGPVSKLGVLHLSLPWSRAPIDTVLGRGGLRERAQTGVRALNAALLEDTGLARATLVCAPDVAERATGWVAALGPRAAVRAEAGAAAARIERG